MATHAAETKYYIGPNIAHILIAIACVFGVFATVIVLWRVSFRLTKRISDLSDLFILTALVLGLCQSGLNVAASVNWGYGRHKLDIPPEIRNAKEPLFLFWLNQVFFKATTGFAKVSILILYHSIFQVGDVLNVLTVRISRVLNYVLLFIVGCYYFGGFLVSLCQCTPIQKAWITATPGTCIDNNEFRLANAIINVVTSVCIISLPLPMLLQIRKRATELSQFMGLLLLGLVHTSCAIARLVLIVNPDPAAATDPQWTSILSNSLALVEMDVGIIAASLIAMRPCFHALYNKIKGRIDATLSSRYASARSGKGTQGSSNRIDSASPRHKEQGFVRITKTTEIELESRNISTEDILSRELRSEHKF